MKEKEKLKNYLCATVYAISQCEILGIPTSVGIVKLMYAHNSIHCYSVDC